MWSRVPFVKGRLRWVQIGVCLIVMLVAGVALQDRLAKPSLTDFDPVRMSQLEASMWRNYYEHQWGGLAFDGLRVSWGEYGFSWWDGLRASFLATQAAFYFKSETEDPRCLPILERYYQLLSASLGVEFDPSEAARLELEWWRERRRKAPPEAYGRTIAANAAIVYQLEEEALLDSGVKRALAMDYRDRHGRRGQMTEENWSEVSLLLEDAYRALKLAACSRL